MMKVKMLLISLLGIILLPTLALADSKPGSITFTLGGGYIFFAPKRDLKNTGVPAVALAYNYDEKWATEFAVDLLNANSNDPNKHHLHGFVYLLDQIYRFPAYHHVDPYVLGGFNVISLKPSGSEPIHQGGINAGVGAQFMKSNSIALSAEARDMYTFSGGKNDVLLNFGVNFIWE